MSKDDMQSKAAEVMKRILTVGVGAFFLTEESLRGLISDFKLPKDILSGLLDSANKTKADFLKNLSKEVMAQIMEKVNPSELLQELVSKNQIEVNVQVRFKPKHKKTDSHSDSHKADSHADSHKEEE